jgi:hypothetical protein
MYPTCTKSETKEILTFKEKYGKDIDELPNSLMDSNVSMKWKHQKSKELGHAP